VSALVNHMTRHALLGPNFETVSNTLGATAVVLLLVLLLTRELVRAAGGERAVRRLRALSIVTIPISGSFVVVEVARLAYVIL
jgi:hypothetical protein